MPAGGQRNDRRARVSACARSGDRCVLGAHRRTRGDGSCPELTEYIRCRNCPVFAAAARALLDRPLPADYAAEWSTRLATAKAGQHGRAFPP